MKKIKEKLLESKTNLFIGLTILCLVIVIILDFFDIDFKIHDILVEFHGLVFDLIVLGILLTIYESTTSKKEQIERYKEEISDYKFWKTEEAMFRTRGLVKRLVDLNVKSLDLSFCYLSTDKSLAQYKTMQYWKFCGATLNDTLYMLSDMTGADFYMAMLQDSNFIRVNLTNCKFGATNLINAKFDRCNLTEAEFDSAIVSSENWFTELEKKGNVGVEKLREKYRTVKFSNDGIDIALFKIVYK